ncbi:hypothetical protein G647_05888 [Cladophialophora carrionii CBS 160.54]|uniref:BHLH domain-containing protein n=1 Tax=Cladophialophora carrionii CBS 160.54 TaxID=1279043 RepID=V9D4I4_9EURO|nr:uncharacterized protein G647_05888 [Cladophialophora carrionii CBS 160.54]ETI21819.1 hypothetical protein G647_05888 [Cladophialophora carrionii CBS 160.54]
MPYRHLFRQAESSHDFHNQHAFQGQHPQLSIVDPDSVDYTGWHEMDFTTTPLTPSTVEITSHQSLNQKYSAAMDREQDRLAYLRLPNYRHGPTGNLINSSSHQQTSGPRRASRDTYPSSQYTFSQLLNMEGNLPPMDQSTLQSSRADPDSNMTNNDLTTTLPASDSINSSPPMTNLDPIAVSIASRADSTEKLCPLIAGQVDSCQPSRCGPDAPCMNFTTLPPIEECTSVPCITDANSLNETNFTPDSMSVELHQRPNISTRTSTATTSRSSATRRSSSSTATTADSPPDVVPLPPRRSAPTTAATNMRRTTRASHKAIHIPSATAVSSDNDEEEEAPPPTTKSTAPSKADAKQRAKQAHSLVERKYRENLNAKITQLHSTLQNSHYGPRVGEDGEREDMVSNHALPAAKVRKSDVLTEAMNYVNQTEVEMRHMENEIHRLSERVRVLEKLVRCEDCSLLKQMVNLQVQAV